MKIVNHSIFTFYIVGQHHHVLCSRLLPPSRYKLHICTLSVISVSMVLPSPNTWPTLHFWMNLNQFQTTSNSLLSSFIRAPKQTNANKEKNQVSFFEWMDFIPGPKNQVSFFEWMDFIPGPELDNNCNKSDIFHIHV